MIFFNLVILLIIKLSEQLVQENSLSEHYQKEHSFIQPYGGISFELKINIHFPSFFIKYLT